MPQRLILGSSSPARKFLLEKALAQPSPLSFETFCPDVDEAILPNELAQQAVLRLARAKMSSCRLQISDAFIITADTLGSCGRRVLSKLTCPDDVRKRLSLLSGRSHKIITGICVSNPEGTVRSRVVSTRVTFKTLTEADIEAHIASNDWRDKAGSYNNTGRGQRFIRTINGSPSALGGLPIYETFSLLQGLGLKL